MLYFQMLGCSLKSKSLHDLARANNALPNIRFQNSNLLHLAVKYDNVGLADALLQHNANINVYFQMLGCSLKSRSLHDLARANNALPSKCDTMHSS
jgi:hypothetical protein